MATLASLGASAYASEELADRVVVHKSEHKLYLYSGGHLLGVYKVALGLSPVGQKERERDFRTPEGHYFLARRNTRSDFFLAIQVSYPNKEDEVRARKSEGIPLRRYGEPEEFGRTAAFLLSPAASYVTGAMVPVDGGAISSI